MKNYLNAFVVLASLLIFSACSLTQTGNQQALVVDDLYDSFQRPASAYAPKKSSHYINPADDATLIEEEEGVFIRQDEEETNFLNSRSVYANSYADGFNSGFRSGIFSANPWNNWYSNPFVSFGVGGFYGSRIISPINAWGMYDPFFNPYGFNSLGGFYDPFLGYNSFRNPYAFNRYGMGGFGMGGFGMGGFGYPNNQFFNVYGGNNYFGPYVGNVTRNEPVIRPNRGPREAGSTNQYRDGNMNNSPRSGNNSYNSQATNQQRVYSNQPSNAPVQQAAPRRNTNFEYRSAQPQTNYGSSQQNYSAPSSNYSSGGSYSGGGGGGSSRGPR